MIILTLLAAASLGSAPSSPLNLEAPAAADLAAQLPLGPTASANRHGEVVGAAPIRASFRHRSSIPKRKRDVAAANRAAMGDAGEAYYVGAIRLYPWSDGVLYRLDAAPGRVSDIALQPGETLGSVAAGDTARWVIGDTSSGSGPSRRSHVLVKPIAPGLVTNLVIATDRRVYHVELESRAGPAMTGIGWTYPDDGLVPLRAPPAAVEQPVAAEAAVETLDFNYRIEGDEVPWRPLRAFNDGRQVFIEFPPGLAAAEAPPLFVLGDHGGAELVNYRLRGHYYVVDRLFGAAELRLGEKRQQVVRIVHGDPRHGGRAS